MVRKLECRTLSRESRGSSARFSVYIFFYILPVSIGTYIKSRRSYFVALPGEIKDI